MLSLAIVYLGLGALAPVCMLAQRLAPAGSVPRAFERGRGVDWMYWLLTPIGTGVLTRAVTLSLAAIVALLLGVGWTELPGLMTVFYERSPLPFGGLPWGVQLVVALVICDFISYWSHRFRHHPRFFPLHAVHHSATELDWLAAARMHPLDDLVDNVAVTLPVLLLGFAPTVFVVVGPLLLLHTLYLHAAFRLRLAPLRYVLATPDFHRWHHALHSEGANFGGIFACWDWMFGTFHLPADEPTAFGVSGPDALPETLGGQLRIPLLRVLTRRPGPR